MSFRGGLRDALEKAWRVIDCSIRCGINDIDWTIDWLSWVCEVDLSWDLRRANCNFFG